MLKGRVRIADVMMAVLPFALFLASMIMIEIGYQHHLALINSGARAPSSAGSTVTLAVLSLMGLVLAFSYSNAASRLDAARLSILAEVNAISAVWFCLDVAEHEAQESLRDLVRRYLETRILAYEVFADDTEYRRQLDAGAELFKETWKLGVAGTTVSPNRIILLTTLSKMSETAAARTLLMGTHLPTNILIILVAIVLVGSMLIGTLLGGVGNRMWFERVTIAVLLSLVVFSIMDVEYPRHGTKLLRRADAMLSNLRSSIS